MHAYLFVGGDPEEREKVLSESAKENAERVYEFPLQKIADVRSLADFTKFSQDTKTSIILKDVDSATSEALNAFLKNLEEPGKNISYFLSCSNEQALLPTIVSRCQVKRLGRNSKDTDSSFTSDFLKMSFGQKIKSFEVLKKKNDAKKHLEKLVLGAHKTMIEKGKNSEEEVYLIKTAQNVIRNLGMNANVNLQMTYLAVKLHAKETFL